MSSRLKVQKWEKSFLSIQHIKVFGSLSGGKTCLVTLYANFAELLDSVRKACFGIKRKKYFFEHLSRLFELKYSNFMLLAIKKY